MPLFHSVLQMTRPKFGESVGPMMAEKFKVRGVGGGPGARQPRLGSGVGTQGERRAGKSSPFKLDENRRKKTYICIIEQIPTGLV